MLKKSKIPLLTWLVNLALAFMFSYAIEAGMHAPNDSFAQNFAGSFDMLGAVSSAGGFVDLIIAIFLIACQKKQYGTGFLLSAISLLLIGFFTNNFSMILITGKLLHLCNQIRVGTIQ